MIDNKHIQSFIRVLDLGSFSKAAQSLNIAQPALSQHVQKLEVALGAKLLERSSRGVTPTAAGREFSGRAREILSLVDSAERRFRAEEQQLFGEVRLGLPGSVCPVLAPELLVRARKQFPEVNLIITELMSGDLADMLREGRMDAAVLFNVEETEDFSSEPIFVERLHLIGAPDADLLQTGTISACQVSNVPLVGTYPPHGLRLLLERWSSEFGIPLAFDFEADSPSVLVRLSAKGRCYSIVAKAAIAHEIESALLASAEISNPCIERTGCICISKRIPPDKARESLVMLVKSVARELAATGQWPGAEAIHFE
ncbi:LysR family transcriptional regulator [Ruegeria sp. HKCCD4884]|uniref:LysR family transcriptional regulator n=1 Tax=Ruegeria sp. HKCCD4884 TaxID=2683022 RepID=UPI0014921C05|nr:LysR family transcriptional regulator [Ruegeria sp. HKCCD4884]NOD92112.1 LysR family transcriptional regulator [Ruegeria sp. HKCCD4884]